MCWLYILTNKETGRYYIGSTNNLEARIKQHRHGHTRTTKILGTYDLIYTEMFDTIIEARNEEKRLKRAKNRKYIDWYIINNRVRSSTGRATPS